MKVPYHLQAYFRAMSWLRRERGAATTEYALLMTLIVVFLISTLGQLGQTLKNKLLEIISQLNGI